MKADRFRGVGPALVTAFAADGTIDEAAYRAHVEWMIESGVDYIVPCGTTGESVTMSPDEQAVVIGMAVDQAAGRVPVLAGAGTNSTAEAIEGAKAAVRAGADAILTVSPYYNKPTQEGIFLHYSAVAEAAGVPIIAYNVPGRTSSNISAETTLRLAEVDGIIGIKEASGDMDQVMTILRNRPDGFLVVSGDDALTFPMMAMGGDGVISVVGNLVPAPLSAMCRAALAGRWDEALALHFQLLPLMHAIFVESSPIPVKAALEMMGRAPAHHRLPMVGLQEVNRPLVEEALRLAGAL